MKNKRIGSIPLVGKIYISILLVIFAGIVIHAPVSVGFGASWPDYTLFIKSWKEILMLVAGVMALFLMYRTRKFSILRDPIMIAIIAYATLHLALLIVYRTGFTSSLAGLAIDLRYLLYFGLVYVAMSLYPEYRKTFIRVGLAGALVVLIFGLLQVFVLPHDILKYIGYDINTISPYLTIDKNSAFIRINSTLRGPNPLGAYAGLVLTLLVAAIAKGKVKKEKWPLTIVAILSAGGLVALWASYSRSALLGVAVSVTTILVATVWRKLPINMWITISVLLVLLFGALFMARDTSLASNVLFHINPTGGSSVNSNEGHINSLSDGLDQSVHQPFGAGVGSTGSASMFDNNAEVVENQYLFIAHEAGWLGLILFMFIYVSIMLRLWKLNNDWLALGVFASGVGLAIIGMFLPVWADDTVAIIWWGLASLVYGSWYIVDGRKSKKTVEK